MTWRSPEETTLLERFSNHYQHGHAAVLQKVERHVCGCDYGATSWTTRDEADELSKLLELGPGKHLLDLGAGSGWPGLYLADTTGCDVTLVDIPFEGLQSAMLRMAAKPPSGTVFAIASDGARLPFRDQSFDVIGHSDVLCCLSMKLSVLQECRRVIRRGGQMLFSVISIEPSLSLADHQAAVAAGPSFKAVSTDYPRMLADSGWFMRWRLDLTSPYLAAVKRMLRKEEENAQGLIELLGEAEYTESIVRRRRTVEALERPLICRELFSAIAAA